MTIVLKKGHCEKPRRDVPFLGGLINNRYSSKERNGNDPLSPGPSYLLLYFCVEKVIGQQIYQKKFAAAAAAALVLLLKNTKAKIAHTIKKKSSSSFRLCQKKASNAMMLCAIEARCCHQSS
jgi:hypothetical protein